MEKVTVIYTIETNEYVYTREEEHEKFVPKLVNLIEDNVNEYMMDEHPDVEFVVRRVPERRGYNNRPEVYVSGGDRDLRITEAQAWKIVRDLDLLIADNWVDWFESVVTTSDES